MVFLKFISASFLFASTYFMRLLFWSLLQPNIRGNKNEDQDLISYTVSAQSGRATAIFSQDGKSSSHECSCMLLPPRHSMGSTHHLVSTFYPTENQVMSDNDQDMPPDVVPLPAPPRRWDWCFFLERIAIPSWPSRSIHCSNHKLAFRLIFPFSLFPLFLFTPLPLFLFPILWPRHLTACAWLEWVIMCFYIMTYTLKFCTVYVLHWLLLIIQVHVST